MRTLAADATPNLGLRPGTTREKVLLVCGEDPETVEALFGELGVRMEATTAHREFRTSPCAAGAAVFTACLTGLGSASVEVALNELFATGGRVFIHTGTAATLDPGRLPVGSVAALDYVWRDDGASLHYVAGSRRRVDAHPAALARLHAAGRAAGQALVAAVGVSTDAFYGCSATADARGTSSGHLLALREGAVPVGWSEWLGPLLERPDRYCLDMEAATFYTLASLVSRAEGVQWASLKGISNELPFRAGEQNEWTERVLRCALRVAVGALG